MLIFSIFYEKVSSIQKIVNSSSRVRTSFNFKKSNSTLEMQSHQLKVKVNYEGQSQLNRKKFYQYLNCFITIFKLQFNFN